MKERPKLVLGNKQGQVLRYRPESSFPTGMIQTTQKNQKINVADLPDFDLAEMLNTDEDIAAYLSVILEGDDMSELTYALGVVARSRGMTSVAAQSGLTRKALYKALRPDSKPRFDTISRVCKALGVRLVAQPAQA